MKRFSILKNDPATQFGLVWLVLMLLFFVTTVQAATPNVVLIMADDLGIGDVSYTGFAADIETPNIDSLAAVGMRFENAYANAPVCSPSRASLLTGRYPGLVGVPGLIRRNASKNFGFFSPNGPTLPELLKQDGYTTGLVGKWHLGDRLGEDTPNLPTRRGFDLFRGFLGSAMDYYTHETAPYPGIAENWPGSDLMLFNETVLTPSEHSGIHATDLFTQWAVEYIQEQATSAQPFFLYLPYTAPHYPIQPPQAWLDSVLAREPGITLNRAKIVALIEHLDASIGSVVQALKDNGVYDNTLIIFTSDNGGSLKWQANNGPFRDGKFSVYEGGLRVPMVAVWPGMIQAGTSTSEVALTMDLYPTIAELVGLTITHEIDGTSVSPILLNPSATLPARDLVFEMMKYEEYSHYQMKYAVQDDNWKLVQPEPAAPFELYNLSTDPFEQLDLAATNVTKVTELETILDNYVALEQTIPWQPPLEFEHGVIADVDDNWRTVTLSRRYRSPVLVTTPHYINGSPPVISRLRSVADRTVDHDSFDLKLQRMDDTTASIPPTNVHYFVIEEGVYNQINHGAKIEAFKFDTGIVDSDSSWIGTSRSYANTFGEPVVLGQILSHNDPDFSAFWTRGVTRQDPPSVNTLFVGKHVGEDSDTTRASETVGFIVAESGVQEVNGQSILTGLGSATIEGIDNGPPFSYPIAGLVEASTALVTQAGMKGSNGSWAALYGSIPVSNSQLDLVVDEDQLADSERAHIPEQLAYLVLGLGTGTPTVNTPTISPNGGTFNDSVTVTIATTTSGATLFYTLDGTDPRTSATSLPYGGPLSQTSSATLQAAGRLSGYNDSALATAVFTIIPSGGNQPPVLTTIGPQNIEEGQPLTISISATDTDGPVPLVLTATNVPSNADFTDLGNGNGEFSWTPPSGAADGSPYNVTFTATDDGGAGLTDSETVTITVLPAGGGGGSLTGSTAVAPASVGLTNEGSADWIHWGRLNANDVDRKAGVTPQISNYVPLGGANASVSTKVIATYNWTDGTPVTSASTRSGLRLFNEEKGFEFTASADTTPRTLKVYVGANGARARFEASLSDGSAPVFNTVVDQPSGRSSRVITLNYQAASAGQTLTVRYIFDTKYLPDLQSRITLESAALQAGAPTNQAPVLATIGPHSVQENQTLTFAVNATDADGPPPLVLTDTNLPSGASFTDFGGGSGEFNWTPTSGDVAGSPYNVTFTAADGDGAIDQEQVTINVTSTQSAAKWTRWQNSFTSTKNYANPYSDVTLAVTFNGPSGQTIQSYGFWDGGNTFRIRFMFPEAGTWTWQTTCSDTTNTGLHNRAGTVNVANYTGSNPLYSKGYLKVSGDKRYLTYGDNTPFFWLADTAWSAPMNATQADWETFINNRRDKKFNGVLMLIALDVSDARDTVDVNGNAPFLGADVTNLDQWNPAFWQEYERKVQYANDQGIVVTILSVAHPTTKEPNPAQLPKLQTFARNLAARFLGNHVVYSPIWDWPYLQLGNDIGQTLRQAAPLHLITQHPPWFDDVDGDGDNDSYQSAERYYDQSYLDFSGLQTGAGWVQRIGYIFDNNLAAQNTIQWTPLLFNRNPNKPVINLEAVYDSSVRHDPNDPYHSTVSDIYLPRMARSNAYWGVLSGSAGYTFGAGQIYSWGPRDVAPQGGDWPWYIAMDRPSSFEMQYLMEFLNNYQWWRLGPQPELILSQQPAEWVDRMVLAATDSNDLAIAYLPNNAQISVDMSAFDNAMLATWFDPVNNIYQTVQGAIAPAGTFTFIKPAGWQDAVLILKRTESDNVESPVLGPIGPQTVEEGQLLNLLVTATDADGPAPLIMTATNLPTGANFTDNGNGNSTFDWTPAAGDAVNSPYTVTFTAADDNGNGLSQSEVVTITITPNINDAPTVINNNPLVLDEGAVGMITSTLLQFDDADNLPGELTYTVTALPTTGTLSASSFTQADLNNNLVTYTHNGDEVFNDGFTFTVNDGVNNVTGQAFTITINPINDNTPVAVIDSLTVTEGGTQTLLDSGQNSVLTNDTDTDLPGDSLTAVLDTGPTQATTFALNPDGTFSYTHNGSQNFSDSFSYHTHDGVNISAPVTVSIAVTLNQAPVVNPIGTQSVEEGELLSILVSATDSDGPASELVLSATDLPTDAIFTDNGNGSGTFDWTPSIGDSAGSPYNVTFIVTDKSGNGLSSNEVVTITVLPASGGGGGLSGSSAVAPANVDLTNEGTADWVHWGRLNATDVDRKAGVTPQISNFVPLGGANASRSTRVASTYTWTDGIPASSTTTRTGLWLFRADKGFEFTAPADTTSRTLKVYVGAAAARGRFEASLSDGSAPVFNTVVDQPSGRSSRVITLNYQAATAGQTLTVRYIFDTVYLPDFKSWITLESAALQ
jgi:arylsulfatase A-like enzyme